MSEYIKKHHKNQEFEAKKTIAEAENFLKNLLCKKIAISHYEDMENNLAQRLLFSMFFRVKACCLFYQTVRLFHNSLIIAFFTCRNFLSNIS
jgi:hypothetical protein